MAKRKRLSFASALAISNKGKAKFVKLGKVQKVLMSSNCPARIESNINYYAGLSGAELYKLDYPNDELSVICKKPFAISVLALLKGAGK